MEMAETENRILYRVEHAEKKVESPAGELTILSDVSFTVERGEALAIVGSSGSGKSTLLHILGTLDRATSGRIFFEGQELSSLDEAQAARFRNKELGFVFQFHHLLPEFTTVENVAMQAVIAGMPRAKALKLAEESLERVGLAHRRDHHVSTLSGGERQRAAIARATLLCPKVLLADEPTGNLDSATGEKILGLFRKLASDHTIIMITHNENLVHCADCVMHLSDGVLSRKEN
jgi:lipoprotein-releasing system ATP-binding protein